MLNFCKQEYRYRNLDTWEIYFTRVSNNLMRIECNLMRHNRKWWQKRFIYTDWTYTDRVEDAYARVDMLIDQYYEKQAEINKMNKFFG